MLQLTMFQGNVPYLAYLMANDSSTASQTLLLSSILCFVICIIDRSSPEPRDENLASDQFVSEYSSIVTKLISGKDMNIEGDIMRFSQ